MEKYDLMQRQAGHKRAARFMARQHQSSFKDKSSSQGSR